MDDDLQAVKAHATRRSIWLRLIFMIILIIAFNVAEILTYAVLAFQFLASLVSGSPNDQLVRFGRNLARYQQQITTYLTFATEDKPFPFAPWPDEPHEPAPREIAGTAKTVDDDEADKAGA